MNEQKCKHCGHDEDAHKREPEEAAGDYQSLVRIEDGHVYTLSLRECPGFTPRHRKRVRKGDFTSAPV